MSDIPLNVLEKTLEQVLSKKLEPLEDRFLGMERKINELTDKVSDSDMEFIRLASAIRKIGNSQIKSDDKIDNLREDFRKFESNVQGFIQVAMKTVTDANERKAMHKSQHDRFPEVEQ